MNRKTQITCGLVGLCAALAMPVIGGGFVVRLPAGYTRVEYVQGDGTAYVDLRAKFTNLDAIDAEVQITEVESAMIFGSRTDSSSHDWYYCGLDAGNGQLLNLFVCDAKTGKSMSGFGSKLLNHRVRIQASNASWVITDLEGLTVESNRGDADAFETSYDMTLFAGRGTLWTDKRFKGRIYKFTVRRSGVPRFVLVPCTNPQGEVGFFDPVSGGFFGNAEGSGAFVAGPVCASDYSDVEVPFDCYVGHEPAPGTCVYAPVDGVMTSCEVVSAAYPDSDIGIGHADVATFTYSDGTEERTATGVFTVAPMDAASRLCRMEGEFLQCYPVQGGQPPDVNGVVVRDLAGNVISRYSLEYYGYGQSGKATVAVRLADGRIGWAEQIDVLDIPEDYLPVEYVQGDGVAAISLGFKLSSADTVYIWAMLKEKGGQLIYGGRTSGSADDAFFWAFSGADNGCVLDFCNYMKGRFQKANVYDAFVGKKVMAQNGAALRGFFDAYGNVLTSGGQNLSDETTAGATFTCGVNCGLFTTFGQVWSAPNFNGRIYEFRVITNGRVAHELLPCVRKADQAIGFYDAVTGGFHVNTAGAGAFAVPKYRLRVSPIPDQVVTMGAATPKPEVSFLQNRDFVPLAEGRDYTLSYSRNAGLGLAQVTVKGIGEFAGLLVTSEFRIVPPANPQVFLVGDFSLRSHWPKRKLYLKGYRVVDADGNNVGPFTICSANDRETGDATVKAQVTSGPYAGAIAARVQPIVVMPNGYTPVEYVQGDGVAAIDLGFKLSSADTVEIWAMLKEQGGQHIYGGRTDAGANDAFFWAFSGADNGCVLDFCNYMKGRFQKANVYDAFVDKKVMAQNGAALRGFFDAYGNVLTSDGQNLADETTAGDTFTCGVNCGLFTTFGQVWSAPNFNGRIYSFSVTRGGPSLTLVPCIKDATGEVGFYDAVGKRFVGKTTEAGMFTAGPSVPYAKSGFALSVY